MNVALAVVLSGLLVAPSLFAQTPDDSVDARLRRLEQEVQELKKENDQLRRDLGLEVTARQGDAKMAGKEESLQVGGMIQAQSEAGDRGASRFSDGNSRTFLRRARANPTGRLLEEVNLPTGNDLARRHSNAHRFPPPPTH